ncbi:hypothetical protein [Sorangium sp. So ce117]|uniref:hypothetical protein n=1 Tax=Sorangium sp. So ce117 TaxID=3133277 RepID=UPI003F635F7B
MGTNADSNDVQGLFSELVKALSKRFLSDSEFRKRLYADVDAALAEEGKSLLDDWIERLKRADPGAIEDGIEKGELNPSC